MAKANKKMLYNKSGSMDMVQTGVMLVVLLVVLYVGVNVLDGVQSATSQTEPTYATGTYTSTLTPSDGRLVNVSTVTFELGNEGNTTAGHVAVVFSNILTEVTNLSIAINANGTTSALVTSINTTDTVVLTAKAIGTAGNAITTSENRVNATWTGDTLTGGIDASPLYDTQYSLDDVTEASYSMAGIMPIVMIAVAVLAGLLAVLYLFRGREEE